MSYKTLALAAVACGCAKQSDIAHMQEQLDALNSDQIQTISGQIDAIKASISSLEATEEQLQGYVSTLQSQTASLTETEEQLTESIADLREELKGEISDAEANCLAQLEAYRKTVSAQIASLNSSIAVLQAKDEDLQAQIDELRSYIDNSLKETRDWVSASFATLDQYNATAAIVATIQTQIASINSEMAGIKATMASQKAELDKSIADLDSGLRAEIKSAADAASTALEAATDEITKAYTAAIAGAISASESSIKSWVNEQLSGYYTIAQMDSKLEALQTALEAKMNSSTEELRDLVNSLETRINAKIAANRTLIDSLSAALADADAEIRTFATTVTKNSEDIAENSSKIADNIRKIADNAGDIAAAETLIDANSALIENNKTAIAANASAIAALQDKAAAADDAIAKNAADIAANAAAIAKNTIDIENNTTNIHQCSAFISKNRRDILANQHDIQDLKTALADQKTEITDAYTRAISDAITANNGTLDAKLQTEIGKVNDKIAALDARLTAVENSVSSLTDRVDDIEEGLKALTSIAYIPKYADGVERVEYEVSGWKFTRKGDLVLRFDVYPASAAQTIADSYATTLSARAVYTLLTKASAGDFTDLQITAAGATGGILSVTVSSSNLDFDFLVGNLEASLVLKVKTGYNNLQSAYIPLVATGENLSYAQYVLGSFDTDGDEDLSEAELAAITQMDLTRCEDINALDLTVFPNLSKVNCPSLDWLRKLAPAYNVTTVFYSADGASRLYSEDDILIDGIVWQKKNVGAASAEELGSSAIYADALNSTCPEGYHLPWKAEFDALARNYSSLIEGTSLNGRWFSGSRVWSEGSEVPAIFLPCQPNWPYSRYWAYTPGWSDMLVPVFYLDDTDPSQRYPSEWWSANIQMFNDSAGTQIRCVKD